MRRQILGTLTRRQVLAASLITPVALATTGTGAAFAAPQQPAPQNDDVGFLTFGAVAEPIVSTTRGAMADRMAGGPLPPIELEATGARLDSYLEDPT